MRKKTVKPLTKLQLEVFTYIQNYCVNHGYGPLYREIIENTSVKNNGSVNKNLEALEKKGYINKEEHSERGIHLTEIGEEIKTSEIDLKNKSPVTNQEQLNLLSEENSD